MTNQELVRLAYLRHLRTTQPEVYAEAMRRTFAAARQKVSGLGDLSSWAQSFSDLLKNVTSVASQYLTDSAQVANVQTNTTRVAAGLPPLNADGTVMTTAQMTAAGYSAASIAQIEANLAKNGITGALSTVPTSTWLLLGGGALVLVMLLKK